MRVLITAGGTEEPIDGVRRLTNMSTGATGVALVRVFVALGAEVVLLHATRVPVPEIDAECDSFTAFDELEDRLRRLLSVRRFDAIIHLAAVSDYRVDAIEVDGEKVPEGNRGKIPSGHDVVLRLAPTTKLIDRLRDWSRNPEVRVVGFKLTDDEDAARRQRAVRQLLDRGSADLVVHNDLTEIHGEHHRATIWNRDSVVATTETKEQLGQTLFDLLAGKDRRSEVNP
ncbi:MAG: phosphopantothenoylcysteine decarboxylase [Holophagae bacterium]